jgi:hypothetical protein
VRPDHELKADAPKTQVEKTGGEKRPLGSVIHLCDFPGHLLIE